MGTLVKDYLLPSDKRATNKRGLVDANIRALTLAKIQDLIVSMDALLDAGSSDISYALSPRDQRIKAALAAVKIEINKAL